MKQTAELKDSEGQTEWSQNGYVGSELALVFTDWHVGDMPVTFGLESLMLG